MINSPHSFLLLKVSLIAFIIGSISLPSWMELASPFWLLTFFIYWIVYTNSKNIFTLAFVLGIFFDTLQGGILGQNSLALVLSSAFILNIKKSFFVSNMTTQQVYVFIGSLIYLVVFLIVHFLVQSFSINWIILISPFSAGILWPIIRFLLAKIKQ